MGDDSVLIFHLRIKLLIPFVFTYIQRMKIWLRDKSDDVCFMHFHRCSEKPYFVEHFLVVRYFQEHL